MEKEDLKKLLNLYFEGSTTLEQEEMIKDAFNQQSELVKEFPEGALFLAFKAEKEVVSPKEILLREENHVKHISFQTALKWAAVLVIIFSTVFLLFPFQNQNPKPLSDSFENPQEAYEEARKALAMVGTKMKKGRTGAANKMQKFNTVIPLKN